MNLGFRSGDYVLNKVGEFPDRNSEVTLVCPQPDQAASEGGEIWWAWQDSAALDANSFRMCIVECGTAWVLSTWRTVWRGGKPFTWDQTHQKWVAHDL